MERRPANVVNVDEVEARPMEKGVRYSCRMRWLARNAGARGIGCTHYEVPPGRAAFPRHHHFANEEAIYVLEGEGTLRIGDQRVKLRPGDWATLPTGPDHSHQLINDGQHPLRYLCMSTMLPTEIVGYPDSKKLGAMAVTVPGQPPAVRAIYRQDQTADYYDDESADEPLK